MTDWLLNILRIDGDIICMSLDLAISLGYIIAV
jgi:hypothetical protein